MVVRRVAGELRMYGFDHRAIVDNRGVELRSDYWGVCRGSVENVPEIVRLRFHMWSNPKRRSGKKGRPEDTGKIQPRRPGAFY